MNRYVIFLLLILPYALPVFSAENDVVKQLEMDYARFRGSGDYTMLELYFSIPRELLKHVKRDDQYQAEYEFTLSMIGTDSTVNETSWRRYDMVKALDNITKEQHILEVHRLYLRPDVYQFTVKLRDMVSDVVLMREGELSIEPFSTLELDVSDIQLSYGIRTSNEKNQYVKNGYFIQPNPAAKYGDDHSILYYYTELYNLSDLQNGIDSTYTVVTALKNLDDQLVGEPDTVINVRVGTDLVDIGRKKLVSLFSSGFKLELTLTDNATGEQVKQSKRFLVLRPGSMAGGSEERVRTDKGLDEYREMSEEELDELFRKVRYIALEQEKDVYHKLDLTGKRAFMADFWYRRDPDRSTAVNEFKKDYFSRLEIANARYSSGSKKGWRTDQGRILLTYGRPEKIDRSYASLGERESEIWYYYSYQGGIKFVFVDVSGYGEMRLVHSTAVNELQDYDWQERWK